jgi:hypothetical protein
VTGIAITGLGRALELHTGALLGPHDRVWCPARREARPQAAAARFGVFATSNILDANEADRDTAIAGEGVRGMQRLIP